MLFHYLKSSLFQTNDNREFVDRIHSERFPQIERYMHRKKCIRKGAFLELEYTLECTPESMMEGWIYVYVKKPDEEDTCEYGFIIQCIIH